MNGLKKKELGQFNTTNVDYIFEGFEIAIKGKKVIDPFCGTGGILIEIADMQIEAIGIDILKKMVENSQGNLKHYNLKGMVVEGDIQNVENYDFNAIVTDPPYGLSSTTKGEGVKKLMSRSMEIFAETMKKEQRVVMAVSNPKLINPRPAPRLLTSYLRV